MNLEKTASVKSVTTDTKILDAKKVETAELTVDGVSISEIVPKWKPCEHIYRCVLEEDDDYIIYDDEGNFLDCKLDTLENGTGLFQGTKGVEEFSFSLPNLTNGSNMFGSNTSIKCFKTKTDNLTNGYSMFSGASALETFDGDLTSLTNGELMFSSSNISKFQAKMKPDNSEYSPLSVGTQMFSNCQLDEDSIKCILPYLQPYEDGSEHILDLGIDISAVPYFNEITGNEQSLPVDTIVEVPYRGWNIKVMVKNLPADYRAVAYLEGTGTQWISTAVKLSNESEVKCEHWQYYPTKIKDYCYLYHADNFFLMEGYVNSLSQERLQTGARMNAENIYPYWPAEEKVTTIHTIKGVTINGTLSKWEAEVGDFETTSNLHLFAVSTSKTQNAHLTRIYSFRISRNGQLQCNLIPCIDNLGNPCMYDTVTKETFRNESSDAFLTPESTTTYSLRQPVPTYAKMTAHGVQKIYHLPESYEDSEDVYAQENGFKLLTENERPEEGSWRPEWVETDNELILNWIEVEEEEMTDV